VHTKAEKQSFSEVNAQVTLETICGEKTVAEIAVHH